MTTRAEVKKGFKLYCTSYETVPGEVTRQDFSTKEANDSFTDGLELMGVTKIKKHFFNIKMGSWHEYTGNFPHATGDAYNALTEE